MNEELNLLHAILHLKSEKRRLVLVNYVDARQKRVENNSA